MTEISLPLAEERIRKEGGKSVDVFVQHLSMASYTGLDGKEEFFRHWNG
jgi:hypothetical protein